MKRDKMKIVFKAVDVHILISRIERSFGAVRVSRLTSFHVIQSLLAMHHILYLTIR
jgi:hypothetical protein